MSPALEAHLRILSSTPRERIHTHEHRPMVREQGTRIGVVPQQLIEEVWTMLRAGKTRTQIEREIHMGRSTYARIHEILLERMDGAERRERVRELTANGVPERRIADVLGISRTAVQKHKRALNAANR